MVMPVRKTLIFIFSSVNEKSQLEKAKQAPTSSNKTCPQATTTSTFFLNNKEKKKLLGGTLRG